MYSKSLKLLLTVLIPLFLIASTPFEIPEWLSKRFDAHWVEVLEVGDVMFYLDDNRDLRAIELIGAGKLGCFFDLNEVSDGVPPFFGEPEDEILPWMFCDSRNLRMIVWSSPNYHLPNRDPSIPLCKEPDIDSDELQVQTDCQVEHHDWILGHDKELIEIVRSP